MGERRSIVTRDCLRVPPGWEMYLDLDLIHSRLLLRDHDTASVKVPVQQSLGLVHKLLLEQRHRNLDMGEEMGEEVEEGGGPWPCAQIIK